MFKTQILLLFVFLSTVIVGYSTIKAQEGMIGFSIEEAQKTQKSMTECVDALARVRSSRSLKEGFEESPFEVFHDHHIENFKYFWNQNPANMHTLETFTDKVQTMETRNYGFHEYENELINALFSFMSKAKDLIEDGHSENNVLPNYIQEAIGLLDQLSPVEMFIHTHIIKRAINRLEEYGDTIDFEYRESEGLFEDLSDVLQKMYVGLERKNNSPFVAQAITVTLQNNPFKKNEEAMQREGFSDFYIEGLDYVVKSLSLAESLQENKSANPYATPISEFAALIDDHISFARRSIRSQNSPDKVERLESLRSLEFEAHSRRRYNTITYAWFFMFNLRLAILITPKEYRDKESLLNVDIGDLIEKDQLEIFCLECIYRYQSPEEVDDTHDLDVLTNFVKDISALINEFPNRIMIPTVNNLGIMSINRTYGTGVRFIHLNSEPVDINSHSVYPDDVFLLGVYNHALDRDVDNTSQLFRAYFQQKIETLKGLERKAVEYIYLNLTREGFKFSEITDPERIKDLNPRITRLIAEEHSDAHNLPDDLILIEYHDEIREFMDRGKDVFLRLISEMSEEMGIVRRSFLLSLSEQQVTSLHYLIIDNLIGRSKRE